MTRRILHPGDDGYLEYPLHGPRIDRRRDRA